MWSKSLNFFHKLKKHLRTKFDLYNGFEGSLQISLSLSGTTGINNTSGTGGKFTAGGVALIPVVHLDLRIFLRIFKKISNDPYVIFIGLEEDDS